MPARWPQDTLSRQFVGWGGLMIGALLLTYAAINRWLPLPIREVWVAAMGVGWAYTLWACRGWWLAAGSADGRPDELAGIWTGFGLTATLIALLALYTRAVDLPALGGLAAALLGFGFFATGSVAGRGALRLYAVAWWVGALGMFLWPGVHTLLVLAGLIVLLQVAPGFGAGVAAPFAAAFFLVSEGLERVFAVESAWLGLAAAGALTLALRPAERAVAERLASPATRERPGGPPDSPVPEDSHITHRKGAKSMDAPNAYEDLAMVRRLMEETRELVCEHGKHFIVWGLLMVVALLATYARLIDLAAVPVGWIWAAAMGVGWLFSFWAGRRDAGQARVRTTAGRLLGGIWIGFGITATIIGVLGLYTAAIEPELLGGLMAALLGFGFFASSFVGRQRWLRWLALGWWAGSLAMLLWPGEHTLPLMAALIVALQVVPGVVIHTRGRPAVEKRAA